MKNKTIPEEPEENPEEDEEILSFCDIFIPRAGEDEDEDSNEKKKIRSFL